MQRPSRDILFMRIAREFAARSTCLRGQVGAVIVRESHIIAHGYNGAPPGKPHCLDVGCEVLTVETVTTHNHPELWQSQPDIPQEPSTILELGCQRIIHAEANAIFYAARVGVTCEDAAMYSTHEPCRKCAEAILACGIVEVYFDQPYRLGAADFLDQANVLCTQL